MSTPGAKLGRLGDPLRTNVCYVVFVLIVDLVQPETRMRVSDMIMLQRATLSTMNHWSALAQAVRERRLELGFRQIDIENHGGPSYPTLRNIEQNKRVSYSRRTIKDLETALLWPHGHADLILKRGH